MFRGVQRQYRDIVRQKFVPEHFDSDLFIVRQPMQQQLKTEEGVLSSQQLDEVASLEVLYSTSEGMKQLEGELGKQG